VVPREAVREVEGKTVVFLFRDGQLERRAVSLGTVRGTDVEVTAGLSPGDQVVVKGPEGLHDRQRVKVK
jgi:multidrug efflux pump subunit AcrA (membrane-fusion protein)